MRKEDRIMRELSAQEKWLTETFRAFEEKRIEVVRINIDYVFRVIKSGVFTDETGSYCDITEEQLHRIMNSYWSNKYRFMSDDESLKDIIDLVMDDAMHDRHEFYMEFEESVMPVFKYPNEIRGLPSLIYPEGDYVKLNGDEEKNGGEDT